MPFCCTELTAVLDPSIPTQATIMSSSEAHQYLDLRRNSRLPPGRCLYIQSGDPGDFDGYFIGAAGAQIAANTADCEFILVVPERRACSDRTETDVNMHEQGFSEDVMGVAGTLFKKLCPSATLVKGPLNQRNVIPLKFIFSEPEKYGPLLAGAPAEQAAWHSVIQLAEMIEQPAVTSVVLDMNGAMGYLKRLDDLYQCCPSLGAKLHAAGYPITVMAGILGEAETTTLRVAGRDPRATMNALYFPDAVPVLLKLAKQNDVPLLFVTNNVCNQLLRYDSGEEVVQDFGLQGLMKNLAMVWYGPHLKGKCVPFDWVSFVSMVLHGRYPELLKTEKRELWQGDNDPAVLVLRDPGLQDSATQTANLEGTSLWGIVESVTGVNKGVILDLARYVSHAVPV